MIQFMERGVDYICQRIQRFQETLYKSTGLIFYNLSQFRSPILYLFAALVVRFITRRFIGEYDPKLEKTYQFQTVIDNEMVYFEILDSAGESHVSDTRFTTSSQCFYSQPISSMFCMSLSDSSIHCRVSVVRFYVHFPELISTNLLKEQPTLNSD